MQIYKTKILKVPADDAAWFEETFPMYGAWTWFMQSALRNLRELHQKEQGPEPMMKESIRGIGFPQKEKEENNGD